MQSPYADLHLRDPQPMLDETMRAWGGDGDLWVFGYASLIWRPEFDSIEARPAVVHGWHRALQMRSRVNRGSPECPGLVFALVSGGSCRGMVYRIARAEVPEQMERLWRREMPTGRIRPEVAELPHDPRSGQRTCIHAQPFQPCPHRRDSGCADAGNTCLLYTSPSPRD